MSKRAEMKEIELLGYEKLQVVAKRLNILNVKIKNLIRENIINCRKINGQYYVSSLAVEHFINEENNKPKNFKFSNEFRTVAMITYDDVNEKLANSIVSDNLISLQKSLKNILETNRLNLYNIEGLVKFIVEEDKFGLAWERVKANTNKHTVALSAGHQTEEDIANEHYVMLIEILKFFNLVFGDGFIVIELKD